MKRTARRDSERYFPLFTALNKVVDAWEALPGGQNHSARVIEFWLSQEMAPAIQAAREALGRRRPDEVS